MCVHVCLTLSGIFFCTFVVMGARFLPIHGLASEDHKWHLSARVGVCRSFWKSSLVVFCHEERCHTQDRPPGSEKNGCTTHLVPRNLAGPIWCLQLSSCSAHIGFSERTAVPILRCTRMQECNCQAAKRPMRRSFCTERPMLIDPDLCQVSLNRFASFKTIQNT